MKKEIINTAKKIWSIADKNSPTILTGIAVGGLAATAIMCGKAAIRASRIIENEEEERQEKLTRTEIVKETWKCFIPPVLMGTVTATCIISANTVSNRRNAALASLYSASEAALKEYQEKVVETIGEKKEQKVHDDIAKDRITNNPKTNNEVILTGINKTLCYDAFSGRYFRSDIESIRKIQNDLKEELFSSMFVSLNDFYYELGLPNIKQGDEMGWNVDHPIDLDFSSQLTDDGEPCLVVDYRVGPRFDYRGL